ncbi:MAG: DUF3006 domain-containing protein [Oscillospiraceae bacterium]|jgi:hypothetical protein|nr:DUF3006 domain-containing protein [Oscillospiraceae bacterium]MBQ4312127.1 DUF3006 domain-containing protein [Oscillospiraceae bacterium]MBQ5417718.1 DUF3006 domain-containing protein [Oscillospiraceae bacterium]MCR5165625.1 DUF3006 domain-containing protein [Oscillospiraceae bacterium]
MITVDRIENGFAVVTDGKHRKDIPLEKIAGKPAEGTVLRFNGRTYSADEKATAKRRDYMRALQDSLWE